MEGHCSNIHPIGPLFTTFLNLRLLDVKAKNIEEFRTIPLAPIEARFAKVFPGRLGRFSDGSREIILRYITRASNKLLPAAVCFRAFGYDVRELPPRGENGQAPWGCFTAEKQGEKLLVRMRIEDHRGNSWDDESAWYWALCL